MTTFPVLVVSEARNTAVSGSSLCRKQAGALPADPSSHTGLGGTVGLSLRTHVLEEDKGPWGRETEVQSGSPNTQPLLLA